MEYSGKGIYNHKGKAIRVEGRVGGVPNSRREYWDVGSNYNMGTNAHDHCWSTGSYSSPRHGLNRTIKAPRRRSRGM
jgi:hypothetical protein